jgi:hypothetical protein
MPYVLVHEVAANEANYLPGSRDPPFALTSKDRHVLFEEPSMRAVMALVPHSPCTFVNT